MATEYYMEETPDPLTDTALNYYKDQQSYRVISMTYADGTFYYLFERPRMDLLSSGRYPTGPMKKLPPVEAVNLDLEWENMSSQLVQ